MQIRFSREMIRSFKFNRLLKFFLLALFALILFYSISSLNSHESKKPTQQIVYTESNQAEETLNYVDEQELAQNGYKLASEFKNILQTNCHASVLTLNNSCLDKLDEFNKHLVSINLNKTQDEEIGCDKCFYEFNNLTSMYEKKTVYYHTFWQINGDDKDRVRLLKLNTMSYLASQNLCCTKFILWKLDEFPDSVYKDFNHTFAYYIKNDMILIKTFKIGDFCQSGFFKHKVCSSSHSLNSKYLVALSDLVRFAVLDQYGGIYTDGDTIYLKDMRFFWYMNFAYRWAYTHYLNTAVLGFNKRVEPSINEFLDYINRNETNLDSLISRFHPHTITSVVNSLNNNNVYDYKSLLGLHWYFFDGAWCCNDGVENRLSPTQACVFIEFYGNKLIEYEDFNPNEFFHGAFAYHIHYRRDSLINVDSYFSHFEKFYHKYIPYLFFDK